MFGLRIGIDFDNTIVNYEAVFREVAEKMALLEPGFAGGKAEIRTAIRAGAGEAAWMRVQALVYGPGIAGATAFPGLASFLSRARAAGASLAVVSHKTPFAAADPERVNLQDAARRWLEGQGWFGGCLVSEHVFFEATREAKLRRIAALACTHFIDDLPEVFEEPGFPAEVERILFSARRSQDGVSDASYKVATTWEEISELLFGSGAVG